MWYCSIDKTTMFGKRFSSGTVQHCIPSSVRMTFKGHGTICCGLQQDGEVGKVVRVHRGPNIAFVGLAPVINTVCLLLLYNLCNLFFNPSKHNIELTIHIYGYIYTQTTRIHMTVTRPLI